MENFSFCAVKDRNVSERRQCVKENKICFNCLSKSHIVKNCKSILINLGQKICRLFHVLAQFPFTKGEMELDFINRKWMYGFPHGLRNNLKSDSDHPKKFLFVDFNERPLKMMKNAFYFILKALFVLKIFKSLSWHFGSLEKRLG